MPKAADLYTNQMGKVLVLAPTATGQLRHLVESRTVVLSKGGEAIQALKRWIFADIPHDTLKDQWGNPYDHQVHTLLAGPLSAGKALVAGLREQGFSISEEGEFFVPFQTLNPYDVASSDDLRHRHPRAFALARRENPSAGQLVTSIRDSMMAGGF